KLEAGEAPAAEFTPDECLGLGLALAEVFGATAVVGHGNAMILHCTVNCASGPLTPSPSPAAERGEMRYKAHDTVRRGAAAERDSAAPPGRDNLVPPRSPCAPFVFPAPLSPRGHWYLQNSRTASERSKN